MQAVVNEISYRVVTMAFTRVTVVHILSTAENSTVKPLLSILRLPKSLITMSTTFQLPLFI